MLRPLPPALAALLLAGLLAPSGPALAGTVEGTVVLAPADLAIRNTKPSPYAGQLMAAAERRTQTAAEGDTAFGVAWVADPVPENRTGEAGSDGGAPSGGSDQGSNDRLTSSAVRAGSATRSIRMDQLGQRFIPRILAIVVGQTVEFHNSDNVFHNIFSYSPPKRFDLGRYPKGHSRSVTFAKPGAVQVYCDIHSDMRADIIVTPSAHYAMIGPSGRFRIEGVPPGSRTVKVWLPSAGIREVKVDVPRQGVTTASVGT